MNVPGASFLGDAVTFSVWAPRCRAVDVVIEGRRPAPLVRHAGGVFEGAVARVPEGARYHYRLDGGHLRPDPASRWQPQGVHGPSVLVDAHRFPWTDHGFRGLPLAEMVFYEVHVGAYTAAGTFEGIIGHLTALHELGVTTLQLMPVAEFPGARGWGYDGVHLFAPQSSYGGPRGLRRLVDACHARGLSVFLDVVYNHLGPEGNYLAEYGPYFTERVRTPWGPGMNFDGEGSEGVRRHVVENVRAWVREFHIDGFRLDAVHAIHDGSSSHILAELAAAAREEGARAGRRVHVVAESHDNDRRLVLPLAEGGVGLDAVWSDDLHHALHRRLTGEAVGYYRDFGEARLLPRALTEGFAFQGEPTAFWGRPRGTPSGDLPAERFVVFAQNHDQVGNRPRGERLGALVPPEAAKLAAAITLAAPAVPLLFMGEEYGERAPFQFFTSFLDGALAEAVRRGRAADLTRFGWSDGGPDPGSPETFAASRLNHALALAPNHAALREWYRSWLELRRTHPALGARGKARARAELDASGAVLTLARGAAEGREIRLVANLSAEPRAFAPPPTWRLLLDSDDARFAGTGGAVPLAPFQLLLYDAEG